MCKCCRSIWSEQTFIKVKLVLMASYTLRFTIYSHMLFTSLRFLLLPRKHVLFWFVLFFISPPSVLPAPSVSPLPVVHGQTQPPKVSLATGIRGPTARHSGPFQHLPKEKHLTWNILTWNILTYFFFFFFLQLQPKVFVDIVFKIISC